MSTSALVVISPFWDGCVKQPGSSQAASLQHPEQGAGGQGVSHAPSTPSTNFPPVPGVEAGGGEGGAIPPWEVGES